MSELLSPDCWRIDEISDLRSFKLFLRAMMKKSASLGFGRVRKEMKIILVLLI